MLTDDKQSVVVLYICKIFYVIASFTMNHQLLISIGTRVHCNTFIVETSVH